VKNWPGPLYFTEVLSLMQFLASLCFWIAVAVELLLLLRLILIYGRPME